MASKPYPEFIGGFPVRESSEPDLPASKNGTAGQVVVYSWNTMRRRVEIQNVPGHAAIMYVKWNGSTASATNYNRRLMPGDVVFSPAGLGISKVAVYFSADSPWGTNFTIQGWE